jgi:hypothetical protein
VSRYAASPPGPLLPSLGSGERDSWSWRVARRLVALVRREVDGGAHVLLGHGGGGAQGGEEAVGGCNRGEGRA